MASFAAPDFDALCREGPVSAQIRTIEETRRAAVSRFWLVLLGGLALGAAIGFAIGSASQTGFGVVAFVLFAIGASVAAAMPLGKARDAIKLPTLEALARQGNLTFTPSGFDPPVFAEAQQPLFGSWLSSATFTDLFYGVDAEGKHLAFYEGTLTRGHGKQRTQVFSGQFYAYERRRGSRGESVAVPDRGIFNFFRPAGGFDRVRIEADDTFDRKFEVYASDEAEARMLFANTTARRLLTELREQGRVFVYVGPEGVLVAVTGRNRYEPGSMFRSVTGEQRVRLMYEDVCGALQLVGRLQAAFG